MSAPPRPRTPLSMVVLSLVCEEPMHPYRMQALIKERGKDQIANVAQRNSVYQTISALERAGLITARATERDENRPERTVYEATAEGRRTALHWLRTMLSEPAREFPDFPAALSLLAVLKPKDVADLLEQRALALEKRTQPAVPGLLRVFELESEYQDAMLKAELKWLRGVVADLRSGELTWNERKIRQMIELFPAGAPSEEALAKRRRSPSSK
jgi:DNA-binding PadR family transcriptional regulator